MLSSQFSIFLATEAILLGFFGNALQVVN